VLVDGADALASHHADDDAETGQGGEVEYHREGDEVAAGTG
jgi:hypothetical protein